MKKINLTPTSSSTFLNYKIDIEYGPKNCVKQKLNIQIILNKNIDNIIGCDVKIVNILETKIFDEVKSFPSWKERKDFMDNFDLMFNINHNEIEDKIIESLFDEKFKKEIIKKYSNILK